MKFSIFNFQFSTLLLSVFILTSLLLPLVSSAQLVPCGPGFPPPDDVCQLCHFFILLDNIINFVLFNIIIPLAVLLLIIGAFLFFFYAENPEMVDKGKTILTSVIIGLVIIFAAWLILNTFFMAIGVADWTGLREGWFKVRCQ